MTIVSSESGDEKKGCCHWFTAPFKNFWDGLTGSKAIHAYEGYFAKMGAFLRDFHGQMEIIKLIIFILILVKLNAIAQSREDVLEEEEDEEQQPLKEVVVNAQNGDGAAA